MTSSRTDTAEASGTGASAPVRWHELVIAFEGARPLAPPARKSLLGVRRVTFHRGAKRAIEQRLEGARWVVDVTLDDALVSREHATLEPAGQGFAIMDAGSRNGTFVGATRCAPRQPVPVPDGVAVVLGRTVAFVRATTARPGELPPGDAPPPSPSHPGLATLNAPLSRALSDLERVLAGARLAVLLRGPTGSGKDVIARAVHDLHARSGRPGDFVAVNCGAIPAARVGAGLLGARRGALSGAVEDRPGLARAAQGGTLFLDEIGDLEPPAQAALLRLLDAREVLPVGGTRALPVDVAFVSATHKDLEAMTAAGTFRADLYARLAGFELRIPALADRMEDVGLVAAAVLREIGATGASFATDTTRALFVHPWPMNGRELRSTLTRAVALAAGDTIRLEHLPDAVAAALRVDGGEPRAGAPSPERAGTAGAERWSEDEARLRGQLLLLLAEHRGNVAAVARAMGEHRRQVHRWLARFALSPDEYRSR